MLPPLRFLRFFVAMNCLSNEPANLRLAKHWPTKRSYCRVSQFGAPFDIDDGAHTNPILFILSIHVNSLLLDGGDGNLTGINRMDRIRMGKKIDEHDPKLGR